MRKRLARRPGTRRRSLPRAPRPGRACGQPRLCGGACQRSPPFSIARSAMRTRLATRTCSGTTICTRPSTSGRQCTRRSTAPCAFTGGSRRTPSSRAATARCSRAPAARTPTSYCTSTAPRRGRGGTRTGTTTGSSLRTCRRGIGCSRSCRPVATLGASFACSTRTTGGADAPATRRFCSRPPVRGQARRAARWRALGTA
mmetsp:Transcript_41178/g.136465  ORF Transcript_41178/g.136465 Transcript_41178/m.136465 type:complete len:200 (+) Transcript_41178:290-889(+)